MKPSKIESHVVRASKIESHVVRASKYDPPPQHPFPAPPTAEGTWTITITFVDDYSALAKAQLAFFETGVVPGVKEMLDESRKGEP
jgi:hypothetical protein